MLLSKSDFVFKELEEKRREEKRKRIGIVDNFVDNFPKPSWKENEMGTININRTEYVKEDDARTVNLADPSEWEHVCVIADCGRIFEGYRSDEDPCTLRDANVVRKWRNGLGICGLVPLEW